MVKRLVALMFIFTLLSTCFFTASIYADSGKTLGKIILVNNYLKDKYNKESSTNTRVKDVKDNNGNEIVRYNYSGTVLMTSEFKINDNEWVTVAHNGYGYPYIAAYGLYDDEEPGDVVKRLSAAFDDIFNGKYDFSQNKSNIAWIYLDGTDYEKLDTSKLKAIAANAAVTDGFLKEAFEVSYTYMKIVPYMVIGYEKTSDQNDGNRIYACTAQTYKYGMYYKSTNDTYIKSYTFNNASQNTPPKENKISVTIDGSPVSFDVPPATINGRTMVPFRKIFESLGAEVGWDGGTQTVTGKKGNTTIVLKIGSREAFVNGEAKTLDAPVTSIGGRTMVPVRFISESLGCKVDWDNNSSTVIITTGV